VATEGISKRCAKSEVPLIETSKASRGRGVGRGCLIPPHPTRGSGVSSPRGIDGSPCWESGGLKLKGVKS